MAIRAELRLGIRDFKANLDRATQEVRKSAGAMKRDTGGIGGDMGAGIAKYVKGMAARYLPALAVGKIATEALSSAMERQSQIAGLTGVSLENVSDQIQRLEEMAKLPGLGFDQAISGSIKLQAVGMSAKEAEDTIREMGNALALVGGGAQDLDGVILAITQIISKGKVSAEEINQIAERLPQVRELMKDAFGTADTDALQQRGMGAEEFVNGLVGAAAELSRATATSKTQVENLKDAWKSLMVELGSGPEGIVGDVAGGLSKALEATESYVEEMKRSYTGLGEFLSDLSGGGLAYAQERLVQREIEVAKEKQAGDDVLAGKRAAKEAEEAAAASAKAKEEADAKEKQRIDEMAKSLEDIARIKESIEANEIAMLPDDEKLAALESKLKDTLQNTVGMFGLNFDTSIEGLEKLARSREGDGRLPAEGQNSAKEAYEWLVAAKEIEEQIAAIKAKVADEEEAEREKAAKAAEKRREELEDARKKAEEGGFALMTPEQQAAKLRQDLEGALGIEVKSAADIDAGLNKARGRVEAARAAGDVEAEKAALDALNESQAAAKEFMDAAAGLAPDAPSGGVGSLAGLVNQMMGRDPQAMALEEAQRGNKIADEQRKALDKILKKMDKQPPDVRFGRGF
jgi:tape measure domain-containing protein